MKFRFCLSITSLAALSIAVSGCDKSSASDKQNGKGSTVAPAVQPPHTPAQAPRDLISQVTGSPPVAAPPSAPKAGPAFFTEKSTFDIGTVWMGTKVPVVATYKNVGTETLKILEVKPGCGCTTPQTYDKEVPPGGEGRMPLTLDTTNKPNGHMHAIEVKVKTNDPARPEVVFMITGNIRTVCVFDPPIGGIFGDWQPDQSINRTVKMYNNTGAPLTLNLQPIPPNSFFKIDFREVVPGQQWEYTAVRDAPIPEGSNYTQMTFNTNVPEVPIYNVPVSVMVQPRIQVAPPTIVVSPVKPEATPRDIRIINNGRTPLNVTGVETNRPEFNVSLQLPGPPTAGMGGYFATKSHLMHTINFTLPPNCSPPPWGDLIRVHTDDAQMPVIDVYVLGYFLDPKSGRKPVDRPTGDPLVLTPIKMPGK